MLTGAAITEAGARVLTALRSTDRRWSIAVSGGVDSVTLATLAHRAGLAPVMIHATSPAVPSGAGDKLRALACAEGWNLQIVTADELSDPQYRANPYNRCYFCKSALYRTMLAQLAGRAQAGHVLASGANVDDLGEHRPGLIAAAENGVRHPLIEAGIGKPMIRGLARRLGLTGFAELPAQPCLASRVETGLRIEPDDLRFIDGLEGRLRDLAGAGATLRARLRPAGIVVELEQSLCGDAALTGALAGCAQDACARAGYAYDGLRPYRRGSAFVEEREV